MRDYDPGPIARGLHLRTYATCGTNASTAMLSTALESSSRKRKREMGTDGERETVTDGERKIGTYGDGPHAAAESLALGVESAGVRKCDDGSKRADKRLDPVSGSDTASCGSAAVDEFGRERRTMSLLPPLPLPPLTTAMLHRFYPPPPPTAPVCF